MPRSHRWKSLALRLWRIALLALAVLAIRRSHPSTAMSLTVDRIHDFFPTAASLTPQNGMQAVKDTSGITLGHVMQTSPEADDIVLAKLREVADYAQAREVRVALYPHTGMWIEHVEDALRVANKLNRPDVGVTFNLCHWLKVEGAERDPLPVLKAALPHLMFVTICGADMGDTKTMGWDRLIQPLGSGTYDVAVFMQKEQNAGYQGPVGFQGYGIKQEPREVLIKTMAAWRGFGLGRAVSAGASP